ncbi:intradiol ring-cleavage dioxygenase [Burkholderia cenocepacia]|uniref:intradiol ring-cleavage dioxygenase n=1 Tax=Burkholderia cenocepacia TaxID=95486 RepID=UPI00073A5ACC|nr:intradiol ring-cleavage dioxygenase [Burkholderia cenocepacia]ALV60713.1 6-chlorohydroxyquinol-1,2-dioxygenase [Burkholderia cenocepacia]AQQ23177.1 6-chlorohydroxyquinol-1,2-dioxygenase [Burkholderia cenocepacia]AQQ47102.1 6-chlorohydroxyquinol-1,2-dioxygenase [Burkholderia cenocepacia]MBR8261756.1 intradiol ring-cleavage dioxygenase [Burkholderia cenocepacia]MCW3539179.1 intradiol ring-cleavage dioxygenase [Burkholderia cenocepacia]
MTNDHQDGDTRLTEQVVASFDGAPNPRLRELMQSLVRHLHAFVRETELTEAEWMAAIRFLTETGQMCDDVVRQEFILLSDTLGVSMLVDAINHRFATGATETTVFGPFYIEGMPERAYGENMAFTPGTPVVVHGRVLSTDGTPVADAVLDVWQTADNGMYSGQDKEQPNGNLRGRYRTDAEGRYAITSILPVSYPIPTDGPVGKMLDATGRHPWRPAHLHFMIDAPGYRKLVTHLFDENDEYLKSDAVFGVKPSLMVAYRPRAAGDELARQVGLSGAYREATYDFVLDRS